MQCIQPSAHLTSMSFGLISVSFDPAAMSSLSTDRESGRVHDLSLLRSTAVVPPRPFVGLFYATVKEQNCAPIALTKPSIHDQSSSPR